MCRLMRYTTDLFSQLGDIYIGGDAHTSNLYSQNFAARCQVGWPDVQYAINSTGSHQSGILQKIGFGLSRGVSLSCQFFSFQTPNPVISKAHYYVGTIGRSNDGHIRQGFHAVKFRQKLGKDTIGYAAPAFSAPSYSDGIYFVLQSFG